MEWGVGLYLYGGSVWRKVASNRDRMRRTRSRLEHSERISSIDDRFISLWITFNAAYGNALREGDPEADIFKCFIENIVDRDKYKRLERVLSDERFSERVRHLLNNPFIYRGFWESNDDWEQEFNDENRMLLKHLRELRSSNGGRWHLKWRDFRAALYTTQSGFSR